MFKHSDVLIPIKQATPPKKNDAPTQKAVDYTVKKKREDGYGGPSASDLHVKIPVKLMIEINNAIMDIPRERDGLNLLCGVYIVSPLERYRFIINGGFMTDSRIMDEKIYYRAFLGRIKHSVLKTYKEFDGKEINLFYGKGMPSGMPESEFQREIQSCYCGVD